MHPPSKTGPNCLPARGGKTESLLSSRSHRQPLVLLDVLFVSSHYQQLYPPLHGGWTHIQELRPFSVTPLNPLIQGRHEEVTLREGLKAWHITAQQIPVFQAHPPLPPTPIPNKDTALVTSSGHSSPPPHTLPTTLLPRSPRPSL